MGKAAWREYGTAWIQLDPPRHLTLLTVDGMTALADRAHLRIRSVIYDSTGMQFWGSEMARRGIPTVTGATNVFDDTQFASFEQQAAVLNADEDGDQAAFSLSVDGPDRRITAVDARPPRRDAGGLPS
jgi:hypothetical protein